MAWTQADLDKLDAALANSSALQSMQFGNQTFTFRSLEDMLKLRAVMAQAIAAAAGTGGAYRLATTSKGA